MAKKRIKKALLRRAKLAGKALGAAMALLTLVFFLTGKTPKEQRESFVENFSVASTKTAEHLPNSISAKLGVRPKVSMVNPLRSRIFLSLNTLRNVVFFAAAIAIIQGIALHHLKQSEHWKNFCKTYLPQIKESVKSLATSNENDENSQNQPTKKKAADDGGTVATICRWALVVGVVNLAATLTSSHTAFWVYDKEALNFWSFRPRPALI